MSEMRAAKVTVRPATLNRFTAVPIGSKKKRRVAAYARVSTNSEEQATSYEAQVSYYTKHINSNSEWKFVHVYTDKGITGTNTKKREGFNQMIEDALAGKIDLIITKSVSRFARNTVDSLTTIRKLKAQGIEVYFEEQNIYTLDAKGELMLTIMSSLAQEESRSISENVTWGQRKRFADGKVSMPYKHFLGYRKGANGEPEIVEEEAEVVRRIYRMFLDGKTPFGIAQVLMGDGIPTPAGKTKWCTTTILSILSNEKYKGDALLQKTFCTDFLTKKMKINEGEVPQYYVENSHPAIVTAEMFDLVQQELDRRKEQKTQQNGTSMFSGKIMCGCCGAAYGSKVWHSNDQYRRVIWRCNAKYRNQEKCTTPHLTENEIQAAFVNVMNRLIENKNNIIADSKMLMKQLTDCTDLEKEMTQLQVEMNVLSEMLRNAIDENARAAIDQEEYNRRYDELEVRYKALATKYDEIGLEKRRRQFMRDSFRQFISTIEHADVVTEFSPGAWTALVESIIVHAKDDIHFNFRNGMSL